MSTKVPIKPPAQVEDTWREARLLPTTGIGGQDEQELRATSSLLAVMRAVPEFGRSLLMLAGAPAGKVRTFMEVRLPTEDVKISRPDGAMIVERGKTRWVALLEVKDGWRAPSGRSDQRVPRSCPGERIRRRSDDL